MSQWRNTDRFFDKPNNPQVRQVRPFVILTTANLTLNGATTIQFTGVGAATAANLNVVPGMFVATANAGHSGIPGFFAPNTPNSQIVSVTGNIIVMSGATTGNIPAGATILVDNSIRHPANTVANTYNRDVILVTPSRLANNVVNVAKSAAGWTYVTRTVNGDGTVRFRSEVLVALSNSSAANAASGNTSWGRIFSGV